MTEFIFPERRFSEAGVSLETIDAMRQEFSSSDVTVQRALTEFWATQSSGGMSDYANRWQAGRDATPEAIESTLESDSEHFESEDEQSSTSDDDAQTSDPDDEG